jgi:phage tail tape-measure protein
MGAGEGAAAGAALGSVVPGIGTALGAGIGALTGALWKGSKPEGPQRGEITDPTTGQKREATDEEKAGWVNAQGQAASAADDAAVEEASARRLHHKNPFAGKPAKTAAAPQSHYSVARSARRHNNFLGGGEVRAGITES